MELLHQSVDHTPLQTCALRRHDRQSTTSSTLEVKVPEPLLTIGELARRTGVATSALRYWEQFGLLPAPARVSGQRRYPQSAVETVGVIVFLRDVGFTLRELGTLVGGTSGSSALEGWRELARRKLTELDERIAHAQAARHVLAHAVDCPHENILECSTFAGVVATRLAGASLAEAHPH
jgi:DNA-binding transcriptional MerR regulator